MTSTPQSPRPDQEPSTRAGAPSEPERPTVRVVVADDHPVVRAGIVGMLGVESDIEVVGEAEDGRQAVDLARTLSPDVVITDLRMPVLDGVGATREIVALPGTVRVVVLTTYETDGEILRAVEAGATGYLLKDTPRAELVAGIREAARGQTVLTPSVATRLVSQVGSRADRLTPREVEVLRAVARGLSNAAVGHELFISETTVKTHLIRAFGKLGVNDRTHAVTVATDRGLLGQV
ncbi:two component transcriptional regulator, LuxR family [Sanguibacter keddieii DSM 10542]|uniref:Two component transcriptional regulator, LuxR family n=1 Tax=Sanguibacter keddieii (strain ATCC 51767 / DSM 10542 / NCFB 3025 / ST-74) TaxID=446469 RepID=D1BCA8_SANKS|nr:response regulator transcription factor [Sanguibacter keddieii]ACZ22895.1 two component transcriptional regulator, LuxR family [Sanguibacter keddieii DSM 10542]